jgi:hypothetical protein
MLRGRSLYSPFLGSEPALRSFRPGTSSIHLQPLVENAHWSNLMTNCANLYLTFTGAAQPPRLFCRTALCQGTRSIHHAHIAQFVCDLVPDGTSFRTLNPGHAGLHYSSNTYYGRSMTTYLAGTPFW